MSHKGSHNSGNFFNNNGGHPSGPHEEEFLDSERALLTSALVKVGVGIITFVLFSKGGALSSSLI